MEGWYKVRYLLWSVFYIQLVLHFLLILVNYISIFILPFYAPWYISVPLITFLINLMFSNSFSCPLTRFENKLRRQLGLPTIKSFIGHYIWRK
jgi:hypothetical protein